MGQGLILERHNAFKWDLALLLDAQCVYTLSRVGFTSLMIYLKKYPVSRISSVSF